ncbi:MAG TPA: PLP-dependent aminotransferase family protein [Streptosporangiaceae bacterium]|jgi:GntR family transcriptional regulator/MocR family aminotransferase|nr:PLP-dependent aminotransferase family protein [Streptosporangiaceae bacterium]
MEKTWAIAGLDLHLDVSGSRVRAGLEAALRDAVQAGRLAAGTRLPSSRTLAADLGIARNTVADAYNQLVAEGWLTARQGSGTRVAGIAADLVAPPALPAAAEAGLPISYDLRAGSPDLSSFPRSAWLAAGRKALNAASSRALGYGDSRGRPELRSALAGYLARARGVRVTPDRIVVCTGFTQALALLCQVLRERGATTMAVEAYSRREYADILTSHGLTPAALPVDDSGAVLDPFPDAQAVLLTPAHQFPLGPALSAQRRARAAQWAAATGGLVIEDDYDGEFRYDRQPVGALQALAPEHIAYAGSASKTLVPGLRLGWLVLPAHLTGDVVGAKARADLHTGSLEQLTLAEFITSGRYDRHIRRSRLAYRRRRDRLLAALAGNAPQVLVTGIAAGLHAIAELPRGQTEEQVVAGAAARGLAIEGLGAYAMSGQTHQPALVIGYATPPEHAFTAAIARLCAAVTSPRGDR